MVYLYSTIKLRTFPHSTVDSSWHALYNRPTIHRKPSLTLYTLNVKSPLTGLHVPQGLYRMCTEVELCHQEHLLYQKVQQISKKVTSVRTIPLEKLLVPQLVNKLLVFYAVRMSITMYTKARHLSASQTSWQTKDLGYIFIFQQIALNWYFYKQHIKIFVLSKTLKTSPTCFGHYLNIIREILYLS